MALSENYSFRSRLLNFFRSGQLSGWDKILVRISPEYVYRRNSEVISGEYKKRRTTGFGELNEVIAIEDYSGSNDVAIKIASYLQAAAGDALIGAYVHGSIATSEEISYSDFDGLVIVKNDCVISSEKLITLTAALKETERMMLEMDPLQHHGWFILTEDELADYPEYYFPHALFQYSKVLFGARTINIGLRKEGYSAEFSRSFLNLSQSVLRKLESKIFLENNYVFKNLLSEFMLLPAVFIQAKTGKGIFKKFSFDMIGKEMGEKYDVMMEISGVRQKWQFKGTELLLKMNRRMNIFSPHRYAKSLSGSVPDEVRNIFDDAMLKRMREFVMDLIGRLKQ
ncbi:MAG: hypothetical protein NTV09_14705 [Bacteroidetes bacterium]|nr:hypothetical protein [Bacteroidota bacterium]